MNAELARTPLLIMGMRDNCCRELVARALNGVAGVRHVEVNLYRARAAVTHGTACAPADLVAAVRRAGYCAAIQATRPRIL